MLLSSRRFWILVFPDMPRPVGGVKQMHRLAESIRLCGQEVFLVQESSSFHPGLLAMSVLTTTVRTNLHINMCQYSRKALIVCVYVDVGLDSHRESEFEYQYVPVQREGTYCICLRGFFCLSAPCL